MPSNDKFRQLQKIVEDSIGGEWPRTLTEQEVASLVRLVEEGALDATIDTYRPYGDHEVFGGQSILSAASAGGHMRLVTALLDAGADPNVSTVSETDRTAYAPIACADNAEILRSLWKAGARLDGRSPAGRTALHLAASWGDEELVRELLEAGADPLFASDGGETPIQVLIDGRHPQKGSILRMLREAAAPQIARLKGSSIAVRRQKTMYTPGRSFGARDIAMRSGDVGQKWTVVAVQLSCEKVAQGIAKLREASRWEQKAHKHFVADARRFVPVVELKNTGWSLVFVDDLGLRDAGSTARVLSGTLKTESVLVFCELVKRYSDGFAIEEHDWSEENIGEGFDPDEDEEAYDAKRRRMQDEYNAWLAKHQILIPPYELNSTGYVCGITLQGIRKRDIARGDIVVLEEHTYDES